MKKPVLFFLFLTPVALRLGGRRAAGQCAVSISPSAGLSVACLGYDTLFATPSSLYGTDYGYTYE